MSLRYGPGARRDRIGILLLEAAQTRDKAVVEMATAQMDRALRVEGWL